MSDKKFLGKVTQVPTKYGTMTKVWISQQDFDKYKGSNGINFLIKTSKEGKVYLEADTWQPEKKEGGHVPKQDYKGIDFSKKIHPVENQQEQEDLPF